MKQKLYITVSTTGGYCIVTITRGKRSIALRSYEAADVVSAMRFASELSDLIDCDWQDIRRQYDKMR